MDAYERTIEYWLENLGDLTWVGWTITAAYAVALALAVAVLRRGGGREPLEPNRRSTWKGIAVIVAVLGFNKQLDFQTLVLAFGRQLDLWLVRQGLLPRRVVFLVLALSFLVLLITVTVHMARRLPRPVSRSLWELGGLMTLQAFLVVRSPLGWVLLPLPVAGWFASHPHALELLALVFLAGGALRLLRRPVTEPRAG